MFEDFKQQFTKLLAKPITKKEGGVTLIKAEKGWKVSHQGPITKLLLSSEKLEKGKGAQVGEIREWNGKKYKKDAGGKWSLVTNPRNSKKEETEGKQTPLNEEQLSTYARSASTESLKKHSESGDEQMRIAAKTELSRRDIEENPESKVEEDKGIPSSLYDKNWDKLNFKDFEELMKDYKNYSKDPEFKEKEISIKEFFDTKGKDFKNKSEGFGISKRRSDILKLVEDGFFQSFDDDGNGIDDDGLDGVDRGLLKSYTSPDYVKFNSSLRSNKPDKVALKLNEELTETLSKIKGDRGKFYRGMEFTDENNFLGFLSEIKTQIQQEGILQFKTPVSTSSQVSVAKFFESLEGENSFTVSMTIKSKGSAKNIAKYSDSKEEKEYLMSSSTKFKIEKIDKKENKVQLILSEV